MNAPANRDGAIELLEALVLATQAAGGAMWRIASQQAVPELLCQFGLGQDRLDQVHQEWAGHREKLLDVERAGISKSLNARFEQHDQNARHLQLMLVPLSRVGRRGDVLELFFSTESIASIPQVEQTVERLASVKQPEGASPVAGASPEFALWLAQVHSRLDLEDACFALANETRTWSGWDRVSIAVQEGARLRVRCVSGLDGFDRRSGAVQEIESLLESLSLDQSGLFVDSRETGATADSSEGRVADYGRRIQSAQTGVLPLWSTRRPIGEGGLPDGVLLFDQFDAQRIRRGPEQLQALAPHASVVLGHALKYEEAKRGVFQRWRRRWLGRSLTGSLAIAAILLGLATLLAIVPASLTVSGAGVLEPELQQDLFAGANAIVDELHVRHGQQVEPNALLIRLRSPELELELNRLQGELLTSEQQINDLETLLADPRRPNQEARIANELAAKAEEYKSIRAGLKNQIDAVARRMDDLSLRSTLAGQVLTWDAEQLLSGRPVTRADRLLSIADVQGSWLVKLKIDHRDLRPAVDAIQSGRAEITFFLPSAPEQAHPAELIEAAPSVTQDRRLGTVLEASARVAAGSIPNTRPGTTVLYRIDCGQAPVGYVWFRRLIDRVRSQWALL